MGRSLRLAAPEASLVDADQKRPCRLAGSAA
jgi:hypothetical protein